MSTFIKSIFPAERLKATVARFPRSVVCALTAFMVTQANLYDLIKDDELAARLVTILVCGFFWFGIVKLIAESRALQKVHDYALAFVPFALLAAFIFLSDNYDLNLWFFAPALLLLLAVAPFTRGGDDYSVWTFNYNVWFGGGVAFVAGIVLWAGLSAALASVKYLFGIEIDHDLYTTIWSVAALIVSPLYALTWVPERFIFAKEECRAPVQIGFIINWLLAPLVWLYLLILYAYLAKIMVTMELPRGQLAYIISGFVGAGVVTYLAGWPMRESGAPLLRGFYKYFFPILIIPTGMMFFGVAERINAYGITEQRYMLVLAAVWFAVLAVLGIMHKLPLKIIPAALAVLFLFGAVSGPCISGWSQFERLKDTLARNNMLKDGYAVKAEKEVTFEDRQDISSIIDYLDQTKRTDKLRPLFEGPGETWVYAGSVETLKELGIEYTGRYQQAPADKDSFNYYVTMSDDGVDVRGFDYAWGGQYVNTNPGRWERAMTGDPALSRPEVKIVVENNILSVEVAGKEPLNINLADYIKETTEKHRNTQPLALNLIRENADVKARIDIRSMNGSIKGGQPKLQDIQFSFYLDIKDR